MVGNIRANGVRTLAVWCSGRGCGRHSVIDVERYGDDVPVPWFGPANALRAMRPPRRGRMAELERDHGVGQRLALLVKAIALRDKAH